MKMHFVLQNVVFVLLLGSGREVCSPKCGNKHVFEQLGVRSIRWRKQNFKKIFKIKFFETKTFFKNFKNFQKFQKNSKKIKKKIPKTP